MVSKGDKRIGWKEFLLSLFLILVLWGAQEFLDIDFLNPPAAIESEPTGEIRVLFTAPVYPDEGMHRGWHRRALGGGHQWGDEDCGHRGI